MQKKSWDERVQLYLTSGEPDNSGTKKPYCLTFEDGHDLSDESRILVHPLGTVEPGFVNELGARLDAARDFDELAPCVFLAFERARCEICQRVGLITETMSPIALKRHIRHRHDKEPERRDAFF